MTRELVYVLSAVDQNFAIAEKFLPMLEDAIEKGYVTQRTVYELTKEGEAILRKVEDGKNL